MGASAVPRPARPGFENEKGVESDVVLFADGKMPLVGNGFVHSRALSKVHGQKCTLKSAR